MSAKRKSIKLESDNSDYDDDDFNTSAFTNEPSPQPEEKKKNPPPPSANLSSNGNVSKAKTVKSESDFKVKAELHSDEENGSAAKPSKKKRQETDDDFEDDEDLTASDHESPKKRSKQVSVKSEKSPKSPAKRRIKKESEDEEDDFEDKKAKKPKKASRSVKSEKSSRKASSPKKEKTPTKSTSRKRKAESKEEEDEKPKKGRATKRAKKEEEEDQWKWWLDKKGKDDDKQKWGTLEHNGVLFPPEYVPHGIKLYYDGEPVDLTPELEEVATFYSQYLETDHVKKAIFNKNFFSDFRQMLKSKPSLYSKITKFEKCDFTKINAYLKQKKEERLSRTKEEKQKEKEEKEKIVEKFGYALVDGHKQKIGNFRIEPPGLFLGRGDHPKTGHIKKRIMPEDVTINIGKKAPVPPCPIKGHNWGSVIHNNTVTWLAMWKETINGGFKYVWLSASSSIKGKSDMKKFEVSRGLKKHITKIRANYKKELKSKDKLERQRATALWVIDHLALRVGNEKGEDEADTVGCCSLRVEHVECIEPSTLKFDFLGKDSMRYENSVEVPPQIFKNFRLFRKGKKKGEDLFDRLTTSALNAYLKSLMPGLTAKVFRTYNASITLQQELSKPVPEDASVAEKVLFYNRANRQVAILCNHQRSLPKKHGEQMEKLRTQLDALKEEKKKLAQRYKLAKAGKPLPESSSESEGEDEEGNATKKKKKRLPTDPARIKKAIEKLDLRIGNKKVEVEQKEELKTVALGTSKINYMDPRITAAWCKRNDVPIEKIFSKTLRDKFPWAMDVEEDFEY